MYHVIGRDEVAPGPTGTVEFEGGPYNGDVSFLLVRIDPDKGPRLHEHPYPETWIVRRGRALMRADDDQFEAGPGDVVVVERDTPHGFKNLGSEPLELVCIHASGRMTTRWLED